METTTTNTDPMAPVANENNPFDSYNFESSNQEHFNGLNGSTTTTTTTNNNKLIDGSLQKDMAFDGNDNLLNFDSQTTTTTTIITKGVIDVDDMMNENNLLMDQNQEPVLSKRFDNEFGLETDVDAVDEAMLMSSPHSLSQEDDQMLAKEFQQFEPKEVDFTESSGSGADNHEPVDQFIEPDLVKSAAEQEYDSFLKHTSGQFGEEPIQTNMFGLPMEVLGVGDDEVLESVPVDDDGSADGSGLVIVDSDEPVRGSDDDNNSSGEHLLAEDLSGVSANVDLEVVSAPVVTAVAAANVDSECESDDEWNYVKPTTTEQQQQPQSKEVENLLAEEEQPEKADHGEEDQVQEQQFDHPQHLDFEAEQSDEVIQEQHAEAQAIAESQEHCAELNIEQRSEDQLLLPESDQSQHQQEEEAANVEINTNHDHLAAESVESPVSTTSLLSIDTAEVGEEEGEVAPPVLKQQHADEEEDMSSQLNPDAIEFVPLSPQSSAPVSPALKMDQEQFIMGQAPQIASIIMENDRLLAQSPRKNSGGNTAQLDNVAIPDEKEFDKEISDRPHEWSGDLLSGKKIDLNGSFNGGDQQAAEGQKVACDESVEMLMEDGDDEDAGTLNSKEERDLDEEKECDQSRIKEILDNIPADQEEHMNGHEAAQNGFSAVPGEQDPMNMSFHQDVQVAPQGGNPFDLNAVQLLPNDDIEEEDEQSKCVDTPSAERVEVVQKLEQLNLDSALPEADLLGGAVEQAPNVKPMELTESESNFYMQQPEEEAERKEFDEKDEEDLEPKKDEAPVAVVEPIAALTPEVVEEAPNTAEVAVAAAAVAAVAALGVAAVAAEKAKPSTPTAAKKTPTPAKRDVTAAKPKTPLSLGVKASPAAARATPPRVSATSKASPSVAPRVATARASPATTRSPLVEKKTAMGVNTASSAAAAAKKSTPTRPATTSSLTKTAPKATTPSRLTATRTSLAAGTTTSPKPATAASRLTATKTTTATAPAPKRPTTASGLAPRTLTKTTTATATSAARPKTASGAVTATTTTTTTVKRTTVSSSLTANPRSTTTTSTVSSRLMNGTAAKAPTAGTASRVSPATKTTTTTATRAPLSGTRPSPTTTSAAAASKKPTPGSASARAGAVSAPSARPGAAKRVPLSGKTTTTTSKSAASAAVPPKGSKPQPITKRNAVTETVKTTTTTLGVVENGAGAELLNGDALLGAKELSGAIMNGNEVAVVMNGNGHDNEAAAQEGGQKMVIDLTAD